MGDKVLCQALPDLLRKTILTFCEGSVKFERKLEVIGSVHVRSDSEKVVTFLLDEQVRQSHSYQLHSKQTGCTDSADKHHLLTCTFSRSSALVILSV